MDLDINDVDLSEVSEVMPTKKIFSTWDLLKGYIADLREAVKNRLEELDYNEDTYEDGSSEEIDRLLELVETLGDINFITVFQPEIHGWGLGLL